MLGRGVFGLVVAVDTLPRMIDAANARLGLVGMCGFYLFLTKIIPCSVLVNDLSLCVSITMNLIFDMRGGCPLL